MNRPPEIFTAERIFEHPDVFRMALELGGMEEEDAAATSRRERWMYAKQFLRTPFEVTRMVRNEQRNHPAGGGATHCAQAVRDMLGVETCPRGAAGTEYQISPDAANTLGSSRNVSGWANVNYANLTGERDLSAYRWPPGVTVERDADDWVEVSSVAAQELANQGAAVIGVQEYDPFRGHGHIGLGIPDIGLARQRAHARAAAVWRPVPHMGGPLIGNVGSRNVDLPASHAFGTPGHWPRGARRGALPYSRVRYFTTRDMLRYVEAKKEFEEGVGPRGPASFSEVLGTSLDAILPEGD
jgi:hypothetical protein